MPADICVHREGYNTIFPLDGGDPDPYVQGLIRNYVELYVDTDEPELVAFIPSKTTILGLRRENLFYHYRPEDPAAIAEEFRDVLEILHEDDISDGGVDRTRDARRREIPESVVESGIFEEGWSLDKSEPSTQLAMDLADAEPAFPGLSRLQREVVLGLLGEERLVLGIEAFEAGLQAIQYLLDYNYDARVAIATSDDATSLSAADLVLMPGADRNFEPLDEESAAALNNRTGEKIENWTEELKVDAHAAIENLVAEPDPSDYGIYRDLRRIQSHISDGAEVEFDSKYASEVVDIHASVEASEHLSSDDRQEVSQAILQRVEEAQATIADRIRSEKLPTLENAIETIIDSIDDPFETYDQLRIAEEIVAGEYGHELPELDSPPPGLETLREEWWELLVETQPEDPVREEIRTEIEETIDDKKDEIEDALTNKANRTLDAELRRLGNKHRRNPSQFLVRARAIGQALEGKEASDLPKRTQRELQAVIDVLTDEDYDEELCEGLRTRLARKLSGELLEAYTDSVKSLAEDFYNRSSDPQTGLAQLRNVIETGELDREPIDNPAVQDAIDFVQEAYDDDYLRQHDRDAFRSEIESHVDDLTSEQRDEYEKQFRNLIDQIDREYVSVPEKRVRIYENIGDIIDNEGRPTNGESAEARKFATTWREMLDDDSLSSTQKVELTQEIKGLIDQSQRRASRSSLSSGTDKSGSTGFRWSDTIQSLTIGQIFLILIVLVLGLLIGYFLPSLVPFLGSNTQPVLTLDTPQQGRVIEKNGIPVRGQTSASVVNMSFVSIDTGDEERAMTTVNNGSFSHTEENLSVGSYFLTVTADGNTKETTAFKYVGDAGTTVAIESIKSAESASQTEQTPTSSGTGVTYDVNVTFTASGAVESVTVGLYDANGTAIDSQMVVLNETGQKSATFETIESGRYIVEVSSPYVSVDRLEDRQTVEIG